MQLSAEEGLEVSTVGTQLSSLCKVGPPLILDLSKFVLEVATCVRETAFLGQDSCAKWTSSDVCRMTVFSSQSVSGKGSVGQLDSSSFHCRPAWKSALTSADWKLQILNFFLLGPPFSGLGLK